MAKLKIYRLTQDENKGYDTFDSCIVKARTVEEASLINPDGNWNDINWSAWATKPENVSVELIGKCIDDDQEPGIILASFNAG